MGAMRNDERGQEAETIADGESGLHEGTALQGLLRETRAHVLPGPSSRAVRG
jgi:hypothetical protein